MAGRLSDAVVHHVWVPACREFVNAPNGSIDYCALAVSAIAGATFLYLGARMWGWSSTRRATVAGLYAAAASVFLFFYTFSFVLRPFPRLSSLRVSVCHRLTIGSSDRGTHLR